MHTKIILKVLGILLMIFSLSLLPPLFISYLYHDGEILLFLQSLGLMLIIGFLAWYPFHNSQHDLKIRDGFIIVVMFWSVLGFAGAIPFYLTDSTQLSLTNAIFESFSGLTTTGATVLSGLDKLPPSILWYRQQLQWFGGMGIIVLAVAILPMLGIGGMQLYKAETPGPVKDTKLAPRISETAKALWYIYLGLTIACAVSYWLAGMGWFDAITHSFSTVAIGGLSTHDASIGYFHNETIEWVAVFFMFFSGINFALHFTAFRNLTLSPYRLDPEVKVYAAILVMASLIASLYLYLTHVYPNFLEAVRYGTFQAVSIATTTGYSTANFSVWPAFVPVFLILLSFIGGSAGSTAGGMKVIRVILIFKQGAREIKSLLHPNAIIPIKLNGHPIPEKVTRAVWGFFSLYIFLFMTIMLILMALGLDQITAFSTVAATMNNLGPGLGQVSANYASLSDPIKWILTFTMLLGRLEIFTLLVLFTPSFWRK